MEEHLIDAAFPTLEVVQVGSAHHHGRLLTRRSIEGAGLEGGVEERAERAIEIKSANRTYRAANDHCNVMPLAVRRQDRNIAVIKGVRCAPVSELEKNAPGADVETESVTLALDERALVHQDARFTAV